MNKFYLFFVLILMMLFSSYNINTINKPPVGMIYVPAGTSQIGSTYTFAQETPVKRHEIKGFYMDKHPVTVAQFGKFVKATKHQTDAEVYGNSGVLDYKTGQWGMKDGAYWEYPQGKDMPKAQNDHPVTQVSWNDAIAYCKWAGKRLPTEFEWEHAARNGGLIETEIYPWGSNSLKINGKYKANVWQGVFPYYNNGKDGYLYTSPVGSFGDSDLGLQDMSGNVWEWCSNWKIPYSQSTSEYVPNMHSEKVQRGGSYLCDPKSCHGFRVSGRSGSTPDTSLMHVGFRCVKDITK